MARRSEPFFTILPLSCVVVFVANNFIWKATFANTLTGKLSDLLACFFLPLYVAALLGWIGRWPLRTRLIWGAGLTSVVFSAVKLVPAASSALNTVIAHVAGLASLRLVPNHVDPTDLVALVMIPAALLYARFIAGEPPSVTPARHS